MTLAIVANTESGAEVAHRLRQALPRAEIFVSEPFGTGRNVHTFSDLSDIFPTLLSSARILLCIMSTEATVRLLAHRLRGEGIDPAVVVWDVGDQQVVTLVAGRNGEATVLSRELTRIRNEWGVESWKENPLTWDAVALREGLMVDPSHHLSSLNNLLLQKQPIALVERGNQVARHFSEFPSVRHFSHFSAGLESGAAGLVFVTHRHIPDLETRANLLVLRPRDLVLGIGCRRGTSADEIEAAVRETLRKAFLAYTSISCIAVSEARKGEGGISIFAKKHGLPVEYHSAAALQEAVSSSLNALSGIWERGACEPAAVLSAGGGGLLVRKKNWGNVTLAVAEKHLP